MSYLSTTLFSPLSSLSPSPCLSSLSSAILLASPRPRSRIYPIFCRCTYIKQQRASIFQAYFMHSVFARVGGRQFLRGRLSRCCCLMYQYKQAKPALTINLYSRPIYVRARSRLSSFVLAYCTPNTLPR